MPLFAARCLLPRFGRFVAAHRDLDVEVLPSARLADIKGGEANVALRYGSGLYPSLSCRPPMTDWHCPVCSPEFSERHRLLRSQRLVGLPRLRSANEHRWQPRFSAAGVDVDEPQRGTAFDDSSLMLTSAVAGEGVALARHTLAIDDLASGRLKRPFPVVVVSPTSRPMRSSLFANGCSRRPLCTGRRAEK